MKNGLSVMSTIAALISIFIYTSLDAKASSYLDCSASLQLDPEQVDPEQIEKEILRTSLDFGKYNGILSVPNKYDILRLDVSKYFANRPDHIPQATFVMSTGHRLLLASWKPVKQDVDQDGSAYYDIFIEGGIITQNSLKFGKEDPISSTSSIKDFVSNPNLSFKRLHEDESISIEYLIESGSKVLAIQATLGRARTGIVTLKCTHLVVDD